MISFYPRIKDVFLINVPISSGSAGTVLLLPIILTIFRATIEYHLDSLTEAPEPSPCFSRAVLFPQ